MTKSRGIGRGAKPQPVMQRIEAKIVRRPGDEAPDVCWGWSGTHDSHGYSSIWHIDNMRTINRVIWTQVNGPIPDGLCVLHRCDNPDCPRLSHYFLGTKGDNARDMTDKGRSANQRKTHCNSGHALTEDNLYRYGKRRLCRTCRAAASARRSR